MTVKQVAASLPLIAAEPSSKRRLPLLPVEQLLREQHTLTAVERFSQLHDAPAAPLKEKYYRDLIPLSAPRPGEQFAFQVDLDLCTGCKACVSACHTLNGLDPDELWRTVGSLHGGTPAQPAQQTVTTSCHHCLEPACLKGCPTLAYDKDPVTGIVKHLDDQCFGCQYCTLMCPYDAPKFNPARGIVRKCDMCSDRLAHGEAPACVQACPNGAIAIRIVAQEAVVAAAEAQQFLPGAPEPAHTLPTTQYTTTRELPTNLLPADFHRTRPEHAHLPLVIMLILTQLAAGAFAVAALTGAAGGDAALQAYWAAGIGLLGLGASVFHLGRPFQAWRAILGVRTSWLSREALVFGLFAQCALAYCASNLLLRAAPVAGGSPSLRAATDWLAAYPAALEGLRWTTGVFGLVGVYCSVMVYVATQRAQWSALQTGVKFFGSTLLLGAALVLSVAACTLPESTLAQLPQGLFLALIGGSVLKLALELPSLALVRDVGNSARKRMATVMLGQLRPLTQLRFGALCLGGLALPTLLLADVLPASITPFYSLVIASSLLIAELSERYMFFRAAPASRMPGSLT